jgi:hypothetical protein
MGERVTLVQLVLSTIYVNLKFYIIWSVIISNFKFLSRVEHELLIGTKIQQIQNVSHLSVHWHLNKIRQIQKMSLFACIDTNSERVTLTCIDISIKFSHILEKRATLTCIDTANSKSDPP